MTIFSGSQIKFDKDYLRALLTQRNSGVFKQETHYHLGLHPAQLNEFQQSVRGELCKKVACYDQCIKGILLGFENLKLLSEYGVIGLDNCYIHLDVWASFFVFRPEVGMTLKGVVTRISKDHVGCLVYNTFNISLPKPQDDDGSWLGSKVRAKQEVEFQITFVELTGRLPYIRGDIKSILSATIANSKNKHQKFEDEEADTAVHEKPKKKKKGEINAKDLGPDTNKKIKRGKNKEHLKLENETHNLSTEALHIKSEDEFDTSSQMVVEEESTRKSKKSKHKRKNRDSSPETLNALFSNMNPSQTLMLANNSDTKLKRKRSKSLSEGQDLNLGVDSESLEPEAKKKTKKHKNSEHLKLEKEELNLSTDSLHIKSEYESDTSKQMVVEKEPIRKKKSKHTKETDTSLESLNLEDLFSHGGMEFHMGTLQSQMSADSSDKKLRRNRSKSFSEGQSVYLEDVKLEPDSDLAKIIGDEKHRKKRAKSVSK